MRRGLLLHTLLVFNAETSFAWQFRNRTPGDKLCLGNTLRGTSSSSSQQLFCYQRNTPLLVLFSSNVGDDDVDELGRKNPLGPRPDRQKKTSNDDNEAGTGLVDNIPFIQLFKHDGYKKLPPFQVEDLNILYYDVFLILNLVLSISLLVTHRMDFSFLPAALSEGCLLSILWIGSGLYHGSFLMSAVDGHYGSTDAEKGGPKAAAILALNTFVNAVNLRLIFALVVAVIQHRQIGVDPGEQMLPLEIGFGLVLMSSWRALHSIITPRI